MNYSLSHFDEFGKAKMVDISEKAPTPRKAVAKGEILLSPDSFKAAREQEYNRKGDALETARIAGIMAAKRTWELIPLCHQIPLSHVSIEFTPVEESLKIECECQVKTTHSTGVEMEALTGVSVALLTLYDMLKAVDKAMVIDNIRLVYKSGGKSGIIINDDSRRKNEESGCNNA